MIVHNNKLITETIITGYHSILSEKRCRLYHLHSYYYSIYIYMIYYNNNQYIIKTKFNIEFNLISVLIVLLVLLV